MSKKLTHRQQIFVAAYQKNANATQAAIAAGYSKKCAKSQGTRLLSYAAIRQAIEEKIAARIEKYNVSADEILWEINKLAFFDPRKLYHEDGRPKQLSELDDQTAACIAGIDVEEIFEGRGENRRQIGVVKKYKLVDKGLNLERLGRYRKLFTDKLQVTGKDGGPIRVVDARAKLSAKLVEQVGPVAPAEVSSGPVPPA